MKYGLSGLIRKWYQKAAAFFKTKENPVIYDTLQQLYPHKNIQKLYEDHQVKKLCIMSGIILIGMVSVVFLRLSSQTKGRLTEGTRLIRNEWGAGDYSVTLQAEHVKEGWQKEISLDIEERQFSNEERETVFDEIQQLLPDRIKGENRDLQHVESDLELVSSLSDYPVTISWSSDNERIGRMGAVNRKGLTEGEWTKLRAQLVYEEAQRVISYQVYLLPEQLREEEGFFRELENILFKEEEKITDGEVILPTEIKGQEVVWREVKNDNSLQIIWLVLLGVIGVGKGLDRDLEKNGMERKQRLAEEYPVILSKLRLYLSAGMTTKAAFYQLAKDYSGTAAKEKYMYEELQLVCNRLQNGISEETAYRDWGKRCGDMRYRRLAMVLCSHLRLGSGQLLRELAGEEEEAREERRRQARKLGEEAAVKLLFPMLLQLLVVLGLILIPAYMDFGGI